MEIKVGDKFSTERLVTDELIRKFADVSGDYNPIHLDDEVAAKTRFGKRIAHGMLSASLISTAIGTKLPGAGAIYLSQSFRFMAPVYPGDTITARVTISQIRDDKPIITLETICSNQQDQIVVKGEAVVLVEDVG